KPIFILGNQKTGTSAIAALLGEATGNPYTIDVFCHLGDLQRRLFNRELTFRQFIVRSKDFFSKKIVKEPSFTFFYDELRREFPEATFVLIVRDPHENVRSILNRLEIPGDFSGSEVDLSRYFYD